MKLLLEELSTTLQQTYKTDTKKVLYALRPWLYFQGAPTGNFKLELIQNSVSLGETEVMRSSDLTLGAYTHGPIRFLFASPLIVLAGEVTVKLKHTDYSFDEASFLGWVKPHENKILGTLYTPQNDSENPFHVEFWEYRNRL